MKRKRLYGQSESGVAAVEFALIAPFLALLLIGIVDFGLYLNKRMQIEDTARAAAQYVAQGGSADSVQDDVLLISPVVSEDPDDPTLAMEMETMCECADGVEVSCDTGTCDSGDYVRHFYTVSIQKEYQTLFSYPGVPENLTLRGHARLQVAQ